VEWNGSVEALEGAVERVLSQADTAESESIPSLDAVERRHINRVLSSAHGNKTLAARILGIDRKTLHRKLTQYARSAGETQHSNGGHEALQG
jgi:DNA-binding NtrC family response regulator